MRILLTIIVMIPTFLAGAIYAQEANVILDYGMWMVVGLLLVAFFGGVWMAKNLPRPSRNFGRREPRTKVAYKPFKFD